MIFNISEENKNSTGIYCIKNKINDGRYIGQTMEGFYSRWIRHCNMLKNNEHFNQYLQNEYNKYSPDDFEMYVVEICNDDELIHSLEEKYISEFRNSYKCYNFLSGGPSMNGSNNPFYGRKHKPESIQKMSKAKIGKNLGQNNNFFGEDHSGENNGFFGKHHTEEAKKKMSIAKSNMYKGKNNPFYGKKHTPESLAKMKDNWKNAKSKSVICVETGIVYRSQKEAQRQTGINSRGISSVCNKQRKRAGGFRWEFYNEGSMDSG